MSRSIYLSKSAENASYFLVAKGANINKVEKEKSRTPLHLAVLRGNTKVVKKLLLSGADRSKVDSEGYTALAYA
jgi:palmitoyltransferase